VFTHLVGEKAGDLNDLLTHAASAAASRSPTGRPATSAAPAFRCASSPTNSARGANFRKILARNADIVGEQRSAGADLGTIFGVPRLSRPPATATAAWPT